MDRVEQFQKSFTDAIIKIARENPEMENTEVVKQATEQFSKTACANITAMFEQLSVKLNPPVQKPIEDDVSGEETQTEDVSSEETPTSTEENPFNDIFNNIGKLMNEFSKPEKLSAALKNFFPEKKVEECKIDIDE